MPDYSKPPVVFTQTRMFQDWLKSKSYRWPPATEDERAARILEWQREGLTNHAPEWTSPLWRLKLPGSGGNERLAARRWPHGWI